MFKQSEDLEPPKVTILIEFEHFRASIETLFKNLQVMTDFVAHFR